jgi:hypothetical protein
MIVLAVLIIFLPETQRSIAGNESTPLSGFHKAFVYTPRAPMVWTDDRKINHFPKLRNTISLKKAFSPLAYIFEKNIVSLLA